MTTEIDEAILSQKLGEVLDQVQYRNDSVLIERDGKPIAALVDAELFGRIQRMRARFDLLSGHVAAAFADIPMEQGTAAIDAAVEEERKLR